MTLGKDSFNSDDAADKLKSWPQQDVPDRLWFKIEDTLSQRQHQSIFERFGRLFQRPALRALPLIAVVVLGFAGLRVQEVRSYDQVSDYIDEMIDGESNVVVEIDWLDSMIQDI